MDREQLRIVVAQHLADFIKAPIGVPRQFRGDLSAHLAAQEISVITGVRRCGKSTLMRQIAAALQDNFVFYFLDLESPLLSNFEFRDLKVAYDLWLELIPPLDRKIVVFYDEIQNISGWEKWVRYVAERPHHKVFITGSNSEMLSSELASRLTGRHRPIPLAPFSILELSNYQVQYSKLSAIEKLSLPVRTGLNRIVQQLLTTGGFPRAYLDQSTTVLPLYYSDIITRDILRRRKIRNPTALVKLGDLLAREHTRLFNRTHTAALLGLQDHATINKYCEYYKECFLFDELRVISNSLRKQMRSLSKFYCVDCRLPSTVCQSVPQNSSAAFENLVYLELHLLFPTIAYWQSQAGYEIDFVVETPRGRHAFQAAYSIREEGGRTREVRALVAAAKELGTVSSTIVTADETEEIEVAGLKISVMPIHQLHGEKVG